MGVTASTDRSVQLADVASEWRLLGIVLDNPAYVHDLVIHARPDWFTDDDAAQLFEAISVVYETKRTVSVAHVQRVLRAKRKDAADVLKKAVGAYLNPNEFSASLDVVRDMARRRKLILTSFEIHKAAYEAKTADEAEAAALDVLTDAIGANDVAEAKPIDRVVQNYVGELYERMTVGAVRVIPFGIASLERYVQGLRPKDLIVIAGRTGMGKTHTLLHLTREAAGRGKRVMFFSLEMDAEDLAERLLLKEAGVPGDAINVSVSEKDYDAIQSATNVVAQLPVTIVDKRGLTVSQIEALARIEKARRGLDLIIVDYLQLIRISSQYREMRHQVGEIVKALRDMAGNLEVPVVLASQLNRDTERRNDHRPTMADLKESGTIEEHADVILLLYRPDYYFEDARDDARLRGMMEVIISKQRKGVSNATVLLHLDAAKSRISEVEEWQVREYRAAFREVLSKG